MHSSHSGIDIAQQFLNLLQIEEKTVERGRHLSVSGSDSCQQLKSLSSHTQAPEQASLLPDSTYSSYPVSPKSLAAHVEKLGQLVLLHAALLRPTADHTARHEAAAAASHTASPWLPPRISLLHSTHSHCTMPRNSFVSMPWLLPRNSPLHGTPPSTSTTRAIP